MSFFFLGVTILTLAFEQVNCTSAGYVYGFNETENRFQTTDDANDSEVDCEGAIMGLKVSDRAQRSEASIACFLINTPLTISSLVV